MCGALVGTLSNKKEFPESAVCGALVGTLSNKKEFPTTTSSSEVADHREGVFLQD